MGYLMTKLYIIYLTMHCVCVCVRARACYYQTGWMFIDINMRKLTLTREVLSLYYADDKTFEFYEMFE